MKKFNDYDKVQVYTERERLPIGGYILKILNAEEKSYDWGGVLVISFDVAEGDYEGYYKDDYKNQQQEDKKWKGNIRINLPKDDGSEKDGWTKRSFKTIIQAIEESNNGFHWDWNEKKLKDKLIGGLFRNKEYEYNEKKGFFTECCKLVSIDTIKNGKFKVPADKLLGSSATSDTSYGGDPTQDDELPF